MGLHISVMAMAIICYWHIIADITCVNNAEIFLELQMNVLWMHFQVKRLVVRS